ncbi:hypothetical protein [Streptomyces sp. NBC_00286]|uniref:hypothetical protein n=1 Tax=Streptomyces sp. NBC_00286 TaxID=2975701 RepID=UPI002E2A5DFA|nr:hypothetical protein [Streptomyces sp. NBC_00286]
MRRQLTVAAIVVPLALAGSAAVSASPGNLQATTDTLAMTRIEGSSATPHQPQQQATTLDELLDRSALQRERAATATGQIDRCESLTAARQNLLDVAADREDLVDDLNQTDLSDLPNNETLRVDLEDAWDASADSDRNYADWAREAQDEGCPRGGPAPRTEAHRAAQFTDELATESKEAFVELWNPIASSYGLAERSDREI